MGELVSNTKGGFYQWLQGNSKQFDKGKDHDLFILSHKLEEDDFVLIVSTKALLQNTIKENKQLYGFIACDTTHKLISCQFKMSTLTTSTLNREMADIAYIIHAHENSNTFTFAFNEIKKALKKLYKHNWNIKVILLLMNINLT